MTAQVLAELRKMRSTRTNFGLLAGMVALILLTVLLNGLLPSDIDLYPRDTQHALLAAGGASALFACLVGVMAITSEYRHGTIRPTFVVTPRRSRVIGAKVIASLVMGIVFGAISISLSFGVGYAILSSRGVPFGLDRNHVLLLLLGSLAMTTLWAALGVGIGAVIRNQVLAVVGLILWVMIVESLLRGLVPSVGRFTPTAASDSLTAGTASYLLSPVVGGLLLVAYVVAFVVAGAYLVARRDVT
jgi:ABC-2 type transport system permease protein